MHLLRCLVFIEATFNFSIAPMYISTKENVLADDLSYNCLASFFSKVPHADHVPTPAPTQLLDLLLEQQALDQSDLAPAVQGYFQQGLASSTQSTYKAALKKFYMFCTKYDILTPFPVTEQILCYFSAFLANQGLSPQTGKSYLAAVRSMQISLGLLNLREQSLMPILKRVQAGIHRVRMERGTQPHIRLPITLEVLRRIHHHLTSSRHPHQQLLWAISTLAFFGFFRLGELLPDKLPFNPLSQLAWGNVAVDSHQRPRMVQVH